MKLATNWTEFCFQVYYSSCLVPLFTWHLVRDKQQTEQKAQGIMLSEWISCLKLVSHIQGQWQEKYAACKWCTFPLVISFPNHTWQLFHLSPGSLNSGSNQPVCECKLTYSILIQQFIDDKLHKLHMEVNKTLAPTPTDFLDSIFHVVTDIHHPHANHSTYIQNKQNKLQKLHKSCHTLTHQIFKLAGHDPQTTNTEALCDSINHKEVKSSHSQGLPNEVMYHVSHTAKWVVLSELYWRSVPIHIRKSKVPMVKARLMRSCIMPPQ